MFFAIVLIGSTTFACNNCIVIFLLVQSIFIQSPNIANSFPHISSAMSYPVDTIYRDFLIKENTANTHPSPIIHKTYKVHIHRIRNFDVLLDNAF